MIIDFHTHLFPDSIAKKTIAALEEKGSIPSYSDGTKAGLVASLSRAGVDIGVNLPVLTKPTQFDSVLEFAKSLNEERARTGMPILSFAGAHPLMDNVEEKLSLVKSCGILGIKIHPDYQSTYFDDEGYIRIVKAAKAEGLTVVTHAGFDAGYKGEPIRCTPKRVLKLLDKVGGYDRFVLAHYGGNELFEDVYDMLAGEDVYFDTAYILGSIKKDTFMRILEKHGEDKILFASDSPWQDIGVSVERIRSFGLGGDCEAKIFAKNAMRLLGMNEG